MEIERNEFDAKKELEEERENIKSFDNLVNFLQRIKDNYNTDYGTAPRAIAQAALATAWYLASDFGITGFQAGFVMWDFIRDWNYRDNKCGMRIIDYDSMLYPQYDNYFQKTISKEAFESLQKESKRLLEDKKDYAHPNVIKHWQSIVDGKVPFGYVVKDD